MPDPGRHPSRLVTASASLLVSTAGTAVLSFVFVLAVARAAGPAGRGVLAFLVAVPTLLSFASTLGLETSNLYHAGRHPETRPALVGISLMGGVASSALLAALCWLLFATQPGFAPDAARGAPLVVGLGVTPLMSVQHLLTTLLIGGGRVASANVARLAVPTAAIAVFALVSIAASASSDAAVAAWAAGQAVGFVLALLLALKHFGIARPAASGTSVRRLVGYGAVAHVGNLADIAIFRVDALILAATKGASELGLYAAAVNVAEVVLYLPTAVSSVLLPERAARSETDATLTDRVLRLVLVASVGGAVLGALVSPAIIGILFGPRFEDSVMPLRILLLAMIGMAVRRVLWADLAARRRQGLASIVAIVTLTAVVALDLVLIPKYGAIGAAWASAAAYWLGGGLIVAAFFRMRPPGPRDPRPDVWSDMRKIVAALAGVARGRGKRGHEPSQPL